MEASSGVAASLNQCNVFFSHSYLCGTNSIESWQLILFVGKLKQLIIMKSIQGQLEWVNFQFFF